VTGRRKLSTPDDAVLVARARRGDLEAFEALVERHQRPMMARAMQSVRHVEDADDLVQEAFIRAWKHLASLRHGHSFGGWLRKILERLAIDRSRRTPANLTSDEGIVERLPDGAADPEDELIGRELAGRVQEQLDALPPGRQREVFRMRFWEGRPIQDIADRLELHPGTVKVHLFRSSKRLRAALGLSEESR
jgi:RNA polymerase sigma-70 factor (ECF subfamily)